MSHRPIRFFHRGQVVEVGDAAPTRTVLEWLREDARCTGTKEGCAEGDCGACTVIVAELADAAPASDTAVVTGGLSLRPVNACIRFLPTLDGKALLGVEDLGHHAALHPVQQALVDCHGSQCGFCTPGFVMSMAATYERHCEAGTRPTRAQIADDLSGNLCRCTGYRPIVDAGERMFDLPRKRLDTAPIVAALKSLRADAPLDYAAFDPAAGAPRRFVAPRTLDALATALDASPKARLLAGSTDVGLWVTKQFKDLGEIVYVGEVAALKSIATAPDGTLTIGAGATLEDAWAAVAARHPSLTEVWRRFAGPPVRHAGTMGGNVANGSPIGDTAPVIMALDARLVLRQGRATREVRLDEFYVDYMKNRLAPGEFVQAIVIPPPPPGTQVRGYKISKRFDCDISALCAGMAVALDAQGRVAHARFAYGGMAAVVKRAANAETAVLGKPWIEHTAAAAAAALEADFAPITDMRASAAYRREAAGALLHRLWLETRAEAPLAAAQTSVWAPA
jgi:xanthine dehydrogenase small subunit